MAIASWRHKRILITGSRGFVGSHLFTHFRNKGAEVLGIVRSSARQAETAADLTDFPRVCAIVRDFAPDAVFHLASEALVETGQEEPYRVFYNNMTGALNVLEAARLAGTKRIIIASTVHVYGAGPLPYTEDEPARPSRPYETSKTCVDLMAQSYADTFDLPVLIPRFVNIYGPGDRNLTRIVPKTIDALLSGNGPTLWGGNATRDYLFIDDAISAYDLLGRISDKQVERNRIFNFATGEPVSAKKLIGTIVRLAGNSSVIRQVEDARLHELRTHEVDWSKARRVLGWKPDTSLTDGLVKTIAWYRTHRSSAG